MKLFERIFGEIDEGLSTNEKNDTKVEFYFGPVTGKEQATINKEIIKNSEKKGIEYPEQSRFVYDYPITEPFTIEEDSEAHKAEQKYAQDFLVENGTPVLAAREGKVIAIVENNDHEDPKNSGPSEEFADFMNYITISHTDNLGTIEYSQYAHLEKDFASRSGLKLGDRVEKGQTIGWTGATGWMTEPHLHFIVFRGPRNGDAPEVHVAGYRSVTPRPRYENEK